MRLSPDGRQYRFIDQPLALIPPWFLPFILMQAKCITFSRYTAEHRGHHSYCCWALGDLRPSYSLLPSGRVLLQVPSELDTLEMLLLHVLLLTILLTISQARLMQLNSGQDNMSLNGRLPSLSSSRQRTAMPDWIHTPFPIAVITSKAHSKNKKYFQEPFLVLQFITNRGLVSVPGRTKQYLEGPWQKYQGPAGDIYISIYVSMYVSMYLCMYACMYLCTYVPMYVCMYVCM